MEKSKIYAAYDFCLRCITSCIHPENVVYAKNLIERFVEQTGKTELADYLYFRLEKIEKERCYSDDVLTNQI